MSDSDPPLFRPLAALNLKHSPESLAAIISSPTSVGWTQQSSLTNQLLVTPDWNDHNTDRLRHDDAHRVG